MKTNLSFKVLGASAILSAALLFGAPSSEPVQAASVQTQEYKKTDLKSLEQLKQIAVDYFNKGESRPEELIVYSSKDYEEELGMYYFTSMDISEKIQGYTSYGNTLQIGVEEIKKGLYKNTIYVYNDREEARDKEWNNILDKAEKHIVDNYSLKTDAEVVHAIVDFVGQQITNGKGIDEDKEFILGYDIGNSCTGYTNYAAELYKRFGIESRYVHGVGSTGNAHAWNAVKVGGNWYHSDVMRYDSGDAKIKSAALMTANNGNKALNTNFKATDVAFQDSMAKPYNYQEVKKAQAPKNNTKQSSKK
ncbi:transglutaminase domain-containing protein [Solibacillus cecembensis]|uniref:transglutaminase domain-containing protein n=1 Tax=Solibacillus cecembensis TaxID=459347 RepID=UPI003D0733DD